MNKAVSISLVFFMLTAMLHLSVATHFCGGKIAGVKISVSGKLASCGMEDYDKGNNMPMPGTQLSEQCCDDVVTCLAINSDFTPSFCTIPEYHQVNVQDFNIPSRFPVNFTAALPTFSTDASPPFALKFNSVVLSDICVFRI